MLLKSASVKFQHQTCIVLHSLTFVLTIHIIVVPFLGKRRIIYTEGELKNEIKRK